VVALAPTARAEPLDDAAAGLIADIERIVAAEESDAWFVDADAYRAMYPTLLESVCRTPPASRSRALAVLEHRAQQAGDARTIYERAGRRTGDVDRALFAERHRRALELALQSADRDCPFWVEPAPDFQGRQTDRNRFTLSLETGGMAQLRQTAGTWTLGGGGLARVLPGYGFGGRFSILAGIEFGGGAMIRPNTDPTEFVINYFPALPVVVRFHHVAWHYDVEVAPVALFQADDGDFSYGGRLAFAAGVFALRTRGVLPWAGAALAYEHYVESGGRPAAHFIRGGLRVGLVWDP